MRTKKELDVDPKAIQKIEFVGKKLDANSNATDAGNGKSMSVLAALEIIK